MIDALKPDSSLVRYGTTIATGLRMTASLVMLQSLTAYSGLALTSNVTGLAFSHTKAGQVAESFLMMVALSELGAQGIQEHNGSMMWMAGVGMIAFGNAFVNHVRYTKLCPEKWRLHEQSQEAELPKDPYEQKTKTNFSFVDGAKELVQSILPATWIRTGAKELTNSKNETFKKFGEDLLAISHRKLFAPGTTAIAGVTPFIVDNLPHLFDEKGWQRAVGGLLILAGQSIFSISMPRKQDHPVKLVFEKCRELIFGKKDNDHSATINEELIP